MAYDIGDSITVGNSTSTGGAAFTIANGTATDPTSVLLTLRQPDGTELEYGYPGAGADGTLTRESAGRFSRNLTVDQAGVWYWRLVGTGAAAAAAEGAFYVQRSDVLAS